MHCEPPETLVEDVDCEAALGSVERLAPGASLKICSAYLLEQLDVRTPKAAHLALGPTEV